MAHLIRSLYTVIITLSHEVYFLREKVYTVEKGSINMYFYFGATLHTTVIYLLRATPIAHVKNFPSNSFWDDHII